MLLYIKLLYSFGFKASDLNSSAVFLLGLLIQTVLGGLQPWCFSAIVHHQKSSIWGEMLEKEAVGAPSLECPRSGRMGPGHPDLVGSNQPMAGSGAGWAFRAFTTEATTLSHPSRR